MTPTLADAPGPRLCRFAHAHRPHEVTTCHAGVIPGIRLLARPTHPRRSRSRRSATHRRPTPAHSSLRADARPPSLPCGDRRRVTVRSLFAASSCPRPSVAARHALRSPAGCAALTRRVGRPMLPIRLLPLIRRPPPETTDHQLSPYSPACAVQSGTGSGRSRRGIVSPRGRCLREDNDC